MRLKLIDRLFGGAENDDEAATLDHVPVTAADDAAARLHAKKLRQAARRHGKPFHTHARVERETPPSHLLQEIEAKARTTQPEEAAARVIVPSIAGGRRQA
ncbi:MAG: hypothetical protein IT529_06305 [Burkholderiales bacterium]|nr:hypothetical protein [Burkholderiales bacterium]